MAIAWTKQLWIHDLRTNQHFTLKTNPLKREHLAEFVELDQVGQRHLRQATSSANNPDGRCRIYSCDELVTRDKHKGSRGSLCLLLSDCATYSESMKLRSLSLRLGSGNPACPRT